MQWEMDVIVTSNEAHCDCRTRVRLPCSRLVQSDVPDEDTSRLRHELEGIGLGFEEHIQQTERFALLAADPDVNLDGFSDGSLSGDGNNGGCSWMIALVTDGNIMQGDVLAGGGGAALAADNTNVLLSSTRMEALGLAAGMSYARNWVGKVDWYIGNMGVINNFRKMHRWVANEWSKAGDRDVNGYLNVLRNEVKGVWTVHHQLGHVEKRKKNRVLDKWTMVEWGNWIADGWYRRKCAQTS
jgi:hypothetical protein